jgi:hypothetical protein
LNNVTHLNIKIYSILSKTKQQNKIPLDLKDKILCWFAGFTDGEGSFNLNLSKYKNKQGLIKKNIKFIFRIRLHIEDVDVLYRIQKKIRNRKSFVTK